ncbi:SOS response-associated peptidase [Cellulomonas sp. KRMCY2]|uniref:SOS response-associated peptidase n=1 Tax=Cellulomonas sp. KRMCY2 TaxID=1304865 RepID=UPI00045E9439|nr:SOS response-associated peptidase [Cellulomonas sp. KRMCY2]
MCGRYASFREAQDLADAFAVSAGTVAQDARLLPPSWNLAPTDPVRVVVEREPRPAEQGDAASGAPLETERSLRLARWGLVPGWAKDPSVGARMINARVESLVDKPAFRRALVARRCLVPAEGYYEWQKPEPDAPRAPKQPFWIHPQDGGILAFAGLYEFWRDRNRADDDPLRWLVTMTIVTGGAPADDPELAAIHDRRPVVLDPSRWDAWLDPLRQDATEAVDLLLRPAPPLVATPVSTAVNTVGNDGPELIEPMTAGDDRPA